MSASNKYIKNAIPIAMLLIFSSCFSAEKCPIEKIKINSADEAIKFAKKIAATYQLISKPITCYEFEKVEDSKFHGYEINVRSAVFETCGEIKGEENFTPRLFTLQIKSNGIAKIDNAEFRFVPLRCPKQAKN